MTTRKYNTLNTTHCTQEHLKQYKFLIKNNYLVTKNFLGYCVTLKYNKSKMQFIWGVSIDSYFQHCSIFYKEEQNQPQYKLQTVNIKEFMYLQTQITGVHW